MPFTPLGVNRWYDTEKAEFMISALSCENQFFIDKKNTLLYLIDTVIWDKRN